MVILYVDTSFRKLTSIFGPPHITSWFSFYRLLFNRLFLDHQNDVKRSIGFSYVKYNLKTVRSVRYWRFKGCLYFFKKRSRHPLAGWLGMCYLYSPTVRDVYDTPTVNSDICRRRRQPSVRLSRAVCVGLSYDVYRAGNVGHSEATAEHVNRKASCNFFITADIKKCGSGLSKANWGFKMRGVALSVLNPTHGTARSDTRHCRSLQILLMWGK